jgi:hypothetical protein
LLSLQTGKDRKTHLLEEEEVDAAAVESSVILLHPKVLLSVFTPNDI